MIIRSPLAGGRTRPPAARPVGALVTMVRLLTRTPILSNSPRMRSAPQSRFLAAISRISATVWLVTLSRGQDFDLCRQNSRRPRRCQRRTVCGWTRATAWRQPGSRQAASRRRSRSPAVSLGQAPVGEAPRLVAQQGVFDEEFAPAANGVDERRTHLRERRQLPPDSGGTAPDAAQDPMQNVDHTSSSALGCRRAKSPAPGDHGRRMDG